MTTAALRLSAPISTPPATGAAPHSGWLVRLYWALAEARMRAAMREIETYRHLIPQDVLKAQGCQATETNDGAFPFTR
jgi:hypothetical protein